MTSPHEHPLDDLAVRAVHAAPSDPGALVDVSCAECAGDLDAMREVVATLGEAVATSPPFALRSRTLAAALARRPSLERPPVAISPVSVYAEQVEALDALLAGLDPARWHVSTSEGMDVQSLVTHLRVVDAMALEAFEPDGPRSSVDVVAATDEALRGVEVGYHAAVTAWQEWRDQARRIIQHVRDGNVHEDDPAPFLDLPLTVGQVLVDRAFETWVHGRDIAAAVGADTLPVPSDGSLARMTDLGARLVRSVLPFDQDVRGTVRLVLRGAGGGTWLVPFDPSGAADAPSATVTLDPIDFCLLIGGRLRPEVANQRAVTEGDRSLVRRLLEAAPSLARA